MPRIRPVERARFDFPIPGSNVPGSRYYGYGNGTEPMQASVILDHQPHDPVYAPNERELVSITIGDGIFNRRITQTMAPEDVLRFSRTLHDFAAQIIINRSGNATN